MDQGAVLAAFDEQMRRGLRTSVSGGLLERVGRVVRCVGPNPDNWSGIDSKIAEYSVARVALAMPVFQPPTKTE